MPRLNIPAAREDLCDFLRGTIAEVISPKEYGELQALLEVAPDKDLDLRTVHLSASADDPVVFRQRLFLHSVSAADAEEEAVAMREDDPDYPPADQIAAHLHLELTLSPGDDEFQSRTASELSIDRAIEWLQLNRKDLSVSVVAGRSFDTKEYEPVLPFPVPPKPFTAVRGLTLLRQSDEPSRGASVYEVGLNDFGESLAARVSFVSRLQPGSDALEKLLQQASEIAEFGVRRKVGV